MLRTIGLILQTLWAICTIAAGTFVGRALGLQWIGWIGGIVFGLIGLGVGAVAAIYPLETIGYIIDGLDAL
ncbi:hypothetical protein SSBR45G_65850 [Bradyrhizobium sp. SSBR45G]|uniref:hypothetical protein n=1 Tax=unclassified Bradyrhizobium TaxID=2631580 RepID=UPI002342B5E5|nr:MULTISPECIES: hypothetical protein [unclassified Bradyrhizobium]GLH81676.1 hypothetical protein SSBR45G_65850 [Bradyrhizobium sp. SSBR45G]GLH89098.1 hypothetical protein SSBR45R_65590 [Bradyrhizobium sp. SSBR45R]